MESGGSRGGTRVGSGAVSRSPSTRGSHDHGQASRGCAGRVTGGARCCSVELCPAVTHRRHCPRTRSPPGRPGGAQGGPETPGPGCEATARAPRRLISTTLINEGAGAAGGRYRRCGSSARASPAPRAGAGPEEAGPLPARSSGPAPRPPRSRCRWRYLAHAALVLLGHGEQHPVEPVLLLRRLLRAQPHPAAAPAPGRHRNRNRRPRKREPLPTRQSQRAPSPLSSLIGRGGCQSYRRRRAARRGGVVMATGGADRGSRAWPLLSGS